MTWQQIQLEGKHEAHHFPNVLPSKEDQDASARIIYALVFYREDAEEKRNGE